MNTLKQKLNGLFLCIKERRMPYTFMEYKIFYPILLIYIFILKFKTNLYSKEQKGKVSINDKYRCLYVSPVGKSGKDNLARIIKAFGKEEFDYMIFAYDNASFDEEIFKGCTIIDQKGLRWWFMKNYVAPEAVSNYDYIFAWPDDIELRDFSYKNFITIMQRNYLEMAQPALSKDSYFSYVITLKDEKYKIGRYTDYVENMIPVFTREAWVKYWNMIETDFNFWGWGYGSLAKSLCGYHNMGVVDCESVKHINPIKSNNTQAPLEMKQFLRKHKGAFFAQKVSYIELK